MIFLLHFALSIADSLELRKLNARGWTLLFCAFISEPFLTWKTRMATFSYVETRRSTLQALLRRTAWGGR
jgi:hypothetical protein